LLTVLASAPEIRLNGIIKRAGRVRIILIIVSLTSGNALLISPRDGEIAAPAITVRNEIDNMAILKVFVIFRSNFYIYAYGARHRSDFFY
jgi:hypothetical protein